VHNGPDASVSLRHAGEHITVTRDHPVTRTLEKREPLLPRPTQPPGREPLSALAHNQPT
jgi:alpha,alpha-trehalose phosphorylase